MTGSETQVGFQAMSDAFIRCGKAIQALHDVMVLEVFRAIERAGVLIPAESPTQRGMDWSASGPQTKRLASAHLRQSRG